MNYRDIGFSREKRKKTSRIDLVVLTVSKRVGWEDIALTSLINQETQYNFKWVIVTEEPNEKLQALVDLCGRSKSRPVLVQAPPPKPGYPSNLNASLNTGVRTILGMKQYISTIMFYQDFIGLETDTIEKLMKARTKSKELQNCHADFITTATHEDGKFDARYTGVDKLRPIEPKEWEANVAIAPLAIVKKLGGFDEDYDQRWSWDNVNLAERAHLLGAKFYIHEGVKPNLHYHPKIRDIEPNGEFHEQRMREVRHKQRPIELGYL